jgi:drug/metabolite transporter (DMT)-like permease
MIGGVRALRVQEVSLLLLLEPVLNAVWAAGLHGEVPGPWALLGCAVILAGTVGVAFRPNGESPRS